MAKSDDKVDVQNVNHPGLTERVRRDKYEDMKAALLNVLPSDPPGITVKDALAALVPSLDQDLFPQGKTSGWWQKTVQLDLEAKGIIARADIKPLHLYKLSQKA